MKNPIFFLLMFCPYFLFSQTPYTYIQTDWSGGSNQEYFTNNTKFFDSYQIDYSSSPGAITTNSTAKYSVGVPFEFKGKIFTSSVNGLMAFDTLTNTWDFEATNITYIDHAILRDTLYIMSILKIYSYDGSKTDYGLGPNGFKFHSNTPESYIFCIDAVGDYLYFGGRVVSSGTAYKFNQTSKAWVKMGSNFTQGVMCFAEYNGVLYAGTHWSGEIYAWNGSSWVSFYSMGLMTVYDFEIFDGKLYACGITSAHTSGKIAQFDGTNWSTIYSGHGVRFMTTHNNKLYFSAQKATPPGAVFAYDGSASTQIYALENEAYPQGLLSLDGDLYYGGIDHVYGGINNSKLHKSGSPFYEIYVRYLNSSTFTTTTNSWGTISYDQTEPTNTGVEMYVMGRDNNLNWGVNREFVYIPNNSSILLTDNELRYRVVLWSTDANAAASLEEVRLQASSYLSRKEIENPIQFKIFPNPSSGQIEIEFQNQSNSKFDLRIYDYLGKLIYSKHQINGLSDNIDLSHLAKGFYFLEIANDQQRLKQKLELY